MPEPSLPPGPKGRPLLGSLPDFHADPITLMESNARLGDITHMRFMHLHAYQLVHPDAVRQVLVNPEGAFIKGMAMEAFRPLVGKGLLLNEGEPHKRQRRMMQPAFHRQRVMGYGEEMVAGIERAAGAWADGQELDMAGAMSRLTLDIAARTLFGADLDGAQSADVADAVSAFAVWYHQASHPLGPLLSVLPTQASRRLKSGRKALFAVVDRMIERRRAEGDRGDILSMLVFARDEDGDGAAMDDDHIRDEAITLLVAGHETTAAALAWAWILLDQNPEVARRLAEETQAAIGDRAPTVQDLPALRYAEGVFLETLRLYPPSIALPRQATRPVNIGGVDIPKDALVMPSTWCTQRDPRWWPEPLAFKPERWSPEQRGERPKFAFYPFGGGARVCIGEAFAIMEGTLVLATLGRRWRARLQEGHVVERDTAFTLRPKGGVPMRLERR